MRACKGFDIREDDLSGNQARELIVLHLKGMHANSPPGSVFALDLSGLKDPSVTIWSAWLGEKIASIGALKMLGRDQAEVKSMRTHPDFLRKGAAAQLLEYIINVARERGVRAFEPALALYRRRGFVRGEPFGGYIASAFNQFFHLRL